ncbi:MAG: hypothetical protein BMS9Abin07_0889 [Acidimicrobiia bacterium]|nr:MAG: hypothetical protein BMS9Abin07_0889 [Acidimicrobiia bacterium]
MTATIEEQGQSSGLGRVSLWRKAAGGVVIVVGIVFIAVALLNNLFAVGPAFEELIDDFRPVLTDESLATARTDIAALEAAGEEFQTTVGPAMAQALDITPEEFGGLVQNQYPAVAEGMAALPEITSTFSGLVDTLDSQQELFASADAIPTEDFPATTVPWIVTISGILAIAAGVMLFMPGRLWAILAVVLGAALLIAVFTLSLPQKAADADQLNENLTPIYTQELIDGATASLATVAAMGEQLQTEMLPDLAGQLGMSQEELNAFMGANFPATVAAMQNMPDSLERFQGFVGTFADNLDNYETIQPVGFSPIIWMIVIGAIVIVLAGGYCLIAKQ